MKKVVIINGKEYESKVNFAPIMSNEKIKNILQNIILDNPELRKNSPINPITDIKLTYVGGKPETTLYINNNPYNFEIAGYIEKDYSFEHIWIKEGLITE